MNAVVKEETRMENADKTYLQVYTEFINGYRHYKLEKTSLPPRAAQAESNEK